MRNSKNIWDEKFNNHSLANESWLEPAIDVFDNISAEIYDTKRQRKKYLYICLLFLALIVSVSMILLPIKNNQSGLKDDKNVGIETTQLSVLPSIGSIGKNSNSSNDNFSEKLASEELTVSEQIVFTEANLGTPKSKEILELDSSEKETKSNVTTRKSSSLEKFSEKPLVNDLIGTSNKSSSSFLVKPFAKNGVNQSQHINKINKRASSKSKGNINHDIIQRLYSLETLDPKLLSHSSRNDRVVLSSSEFIEPDSKFDNKLFVAFGTNFEYWNFTLNNNYSTALNPADFSHSSGFGSSFNIAVGKKISSKLDFVASASIQKIKFSSGHNSSINYQLNQEIEGDKSNMFNLTMASPLGFLESGLTVERRSSASSVSTDLVVDLHNEHSITNLDVNIGLDYKLIEGKKVSFNLGFKTGINKFIDINNNLSSFDLNDMNFTSGASDIVKDQSNVNTITPYIGSSFNFEYKLKNNLSVGTNIGLSMNLLPIYQENDFSTQLTRIQSGVYVKKLF